MIGDAVASAMAKGQVVTEARKKFAELRKATDGMQTAFVKTMVAELQKDAQKEFENLPGSDIYNDMQNQVISEKLTATGHLGLSDALYTAMATRAAGQELTDATVKYFQQHPAEVPQKGPVSQPAGPIKTTL